MKNTIQEVATAIARKHATRTIGAVCSRSEPEDQQSSVRVAKGRDRFSPIGLVFVSSAFGDGDGSAVVEQTRTNIACDDVALHDFEWAHLFHGRRFHKDY